MNDRHQRVGDLIPQINRATSSINELGATFNGVPRSSECPLDERKFALTDRSRSGLGTGCHPNHIILQVKQTQRGGRDVFGVARRPLDIVVVEHGNELELVRGSHAPAHLGTGELLAGQYLDSQVIPHEAWW